MVVTLSLTFWKPLERYLMASLNFSSLATFDIYAFTDLREKKDLLQDRLPELRVL